MKTAVEREMINVMIKNGKGKLSPVLGVWAVALLGFV